MATIKSNTEELKMSYLTAYGTLFNDTLDEYEANMRVRFGYDDVNEDYIEECRYYEVNMLDNTEHEALEAIGTNCNALAVSRMIIGMNKAVIDYHEENGYDLDVSKLTEIGKLYTLWRYVITSDVEWEIEEE